MPGGFAFDQNAARARDEINDALSVMQQGAPAAPMRPQMPPMRPQMPPMQPQMPSMQPQMGQMQPQMGQMAPMQPQMPQLGAPMGRMGGMQPPMQPSMAVRQPFKKGGHVKSDDFAVKRDEYASGGGAWTRKEGKNPEGGLNAKGRASLKAQGQDIKPPVSAKQAKKSPKAAARRKSFCARMGGMEGPMKDDNGKPTRKALALRKWDCKAEGGMIEVTGRREAPDLLSMQALEDFRMPAQGSGGGGGGQRIAPMPAPQQGPARMPLASTAGYVGPTLRGDRFQVSAGPGRRGSIGIGGRLQFAEGGESRVNEAGNYTKPGMRKSLFNSIKAGGKGGAPGQWSARKAQMLAQQYKAKGGGYRD
jgi:hypothetical protein